MRKHPAGDVSAAFPKAVGDTIKLLLEFKAKQSLTTSELREIDRLVDELFEVRDRLSDPQVSPDFFTTVSEWIGRAIRFLRRRGENG